MRGAAGDTFYWYTKLICNSLAYSRLCILQAYFVDINDVSNISLLFGTAACVGIRF
jgi:hypothetical protein